MEATKSAADVSFDLPYYGGFSSFTIRCYMVRNRWPGMEDDFTVRTLEGDRPLGYGATKDDAVHDATAEMAFTAEVAGCLAGRIAYPYGPRLV